MKNRPFWQAARRMLRYRGELAAGLACAILSAGGLGAGLLAIGPVLKLILERQERVGLEQMAREAVDGGTRYAWLIPDWIIAWLPDRPFESVVLVCAGIAVLTVLGGLANFGHVYFMSSVVERTVASFRRQAFRRVVHLPLRTVVAEGSADLIARVVNDPAQLGVGLNALVSKALAQVTKGFAALVIAFIVDWRLTLASLIAAPLVYTIVRKLGKRIRRASRAALANTAGMYGAVTEATHGLRVVKVHTTERYEAGRFGRINRAVLNELLKMRTARAAASPAVEVVTIFIVGILAIIAAKAIIDRQLDPAAFFLALASLGIAGGALKPLTGLSNDIQQASGAADRLFHVLHQEPERGHERTLPRLPRHRRSIAFENVWLTYPGAAKPALRGVDLEVRHGETVAFVGPNGSGKTTLLSLVPRLLDPDAPEEGRPGGAVLVDGRDVREVTLRSLRRQIGVVTQETVLFAGTVRDNIAYGAVGVSEEQVREAARRARAAEFIERLPHGYDTQVAERGGSLSGGQRQRIAIARAILRDPAILILDEATSMIDAESEAKIADALAEFSRGRTTLVVAHRLSTVVNADRIVVMDAGEIVDIGRHDELLQRCKVYRRLAKHQLVGGVETAGVEEVEKSHAAR